MDATSVVAIATACTTGVLGVSNIMLTQQAATRRPTVARTSLLDTRNFEEDGLVEVAANIPRLEGARHVYDTSDRDELQRLANEATRIRMWGSPDVVKAFNATGNAYRAWSDADDGTLSEATEDEFREACWTALMTLEEEVREDLAKANSQ